MRRNLGKGKPVGRHGSLQTNLCNITTCTRSLAEEEEEGEGKGGNSTCQEWQVSVRLDPMATC